MVFQLGSMLNKMCEIFWGNHQIKNTFRDYSTFTTCHKTYVSPKLIINFVYYFIQGSHIKIKTTTEIPVQVDGEPWLQPAGDIVVLKSALKVCQFLSALCWMESMVIWVVEFPREGYKIR